MLGRLISAVTHLGGASHLDSYVLNLHRMNRSGAPTRDEAKRDYAAAIRIATTSGRFSWHLTLIRGGPSQRRQNWARLRVSAQR